MSQLEDVARRTQSPVAPAPRLFDLNIQRVLEHWTVSEAVREIIANALDEQALTNTAEPEMFQDPDGGWHIRDFGRGLRYEHFTQNEDGEKLRKHGWSSESSASGSRTRWRRSIATTSTSRSRAGTPTITIASAGKHGFEDVQHVACGGAPPRDPAMVGNRVDPRPA